MFLYCTLFDVCSQPTHTAGVLLRTWCTAHTTFFTLYTAISSKHDCQLYLLDILPFSFEFIETLNNITFYWNLTWELYYIKELLPSNEVTRASSINNVSSLPYLVNSNTTKFNISICSKGHKGFTIGMCRYSIN